LEPHARPDHQPSLEHKQAMTEHAHTTSRPTDERQPRGATSRRSLLGAAAPAALVLTGAGIGTAVAAHAVQPDAELIRLCAIVVDGHTEMDRYSDQYDGNDPPHIHARVRVLVDEGHRISEQVANMRAATLEGAKAKARAMLGYMGKTSDGNVLWSSHDELLAWSIARDLLGEA